MARPLALNATLWATRKAPSGPLAVPGPGATGALEFARPEPNPSAGGVSLRFALPAAAHVRLELLDCTGRRVRTLADGSFAAGAHALAWDGAGEDGRAAAPGLYFARLATPGALRAEPVLASRPLTTPAPARAGAAFASAFVSGVTGRRRPHSVCSTQSTSGRIWSRW